MINRLGYNHMARHTSTLIGLLAGVGATWMLAAASGAQAADATPSTSAMTGAGAEGTDVSMVIVTAERNKAAAEAPSKASLAQTQPESIISRSFIELATPETGDWTTAASIAPSVSGITANGGGIGDYNKLTLRGFQDGQYNLTFDGIAFGDTNDPTHHNADYFPASTLQAVVVDRGPGAAGDLGQANFGGAIHFFSLDPSDKYGLSQKLTYGSFNTVAGVTTFNTGAISHLNGAKFVLNIDLRKSNSELSQSGGNMANETAKFVMPVGENATLVVFGQHEDTRFNLADAGPGLTYAQSVLYGKNFALNKNPLDEHYYNYNYENKGTDFYYVDLKGQVIPSVTAEDQLYTYYYSNKTTAVNDITGLVGGVNTSTLQGPTTPGTANDIGGYDKLNLYRVVGDIVRVNKEWKFLTIKAGGLVEYSSTDRHNGFLDLSLGGKPDVKFTLAKYPLLSAPTNYKLQEDSKWVQYQLFSDFEFHPTENLTITPGIKYVQFKRDVNAANENTAGGSKNQPLVGSNTYTQTLYFGTANYRIQPDWSVYGQVGTSFLIPALSALYVSGVSLQGLKPETATSYQGGTVYTHGNVTIDADIYRVDVANLYTGCNLPNPTAGNPNGTIAGNCNVGKGRYQGFEGEGAYAFPFGLTMFVNGALNDAQQMATPAIPSKGIAASPQQTIAKAPKWTDAFGGIYHTGAFAGAVTYKQSGSIVTGSGIHLPGYDSVDLSASYTFSSRYMVKVQVFNLADKRAILDFSGATLNSLTDSGLYTYQAGRQAQVTLQAKF